MSLSPVCNQKERMGHAFGVQAEVVAQLNRNTGSSIREAERFDLKRRSFRLGEK